MHGIKQYKMSSASLKKKTVKGVLWSGIERFSTAGVNFIIGLIIARLLSPDEYGIIAMLSIFMAISQSVIDSGFSNALIRKQDRKEIDYSTAFIFNVAVGIIMYLCLYIASPYIAAFYQLPILENVTKVVGITLILGAFSIVQQSILTIKVDFRTQMWISLIAAVISGSVGIIMALHGFSVWALVWQMITVSLLRSVLLWVVVKWKPKTGFSKDSFRYLFGYGSKLLAAGLLETVYRNLYSIIIGKFYQAKSLGLYNRGEQIAAYFPNNVTGIIQRVTFPVFSAIQDNKEKLRNAFLATLKTLCFLVFPVMSFLFVSAESLVRLVLTDKWIECALIIQILCISYVWYPVHIININILQAVGRSDLVLKIEIYKKIIGVAVLLFSLPFGIIWMCWGRVIYCGIELFINMYFTNKILDIEYAAQFKGIIPFLIYSIIMSIALTAISTFISSDLLRIAFYLVLIAAFWLIWVQKKENIIIKEIIQSIKN